MQYLMYRCAELTDSKGFKYFKVITEQDSTDSKVYTDYNVNTGSMSSMPVNKYLSEVEIVMFNEKPEKMTEDIYNAKRYLLINKDVT